LGKIQEMIATAKYSQGIAETTEMNPFLMDY
jgi:hypothetical protein